MHPQNQTEVCHLPAVLFTSCFWGQFGCSSSSAVIWEKECLHLEEMLLLPFLLVFVSIGCLCFVFSLQPFFFFQLMIQIWHGESGWSSRELIRGFSCQNLTPNTWSLILNLGRDLYHGRCWSLWLEAVERVHIGDLTLSLWPLWAWLLLVLQPPGELDPLERSSGSASCCPACESQAFAQLQSTWPCASRSFGG